VSKFKAAAWMSKTSHTLVKSGPDNVFAFVSVLTWFVDRLVHEPFRCSCGPFWTLKIHGPLVRAVLVNVPYVSAAQELFFHWGSKSRGSHFEETPLNPGTLYLEGLGERCKFPQRSLDRNRIWCQQFWWFSEKSGESKYHAWPPGKFPGWFDAAGPFVYRPGEVNESVIQLTDCLQVYVRIGSGCVTTGTFSGW